MFDSSAAGYDLLPMVSTRWPRNRRGSSDHHFDHGRREADRYTVRLLFIAS